MNDWIALFVLCFSAGCMHSMPSLQLVKDVPEEYMNVVCSETIFFFFLVFAVNYKYIAVFF